MTTTDPLAGISTRFSPQRERTPGRTDEVRNSAGGYVHQLDCWKRLDRFLILGTTGGTYYISEQKLTRENADVVFECIAKDPALTVARIVAVSVEGRAPKPNPAIFALAAAAGSDDPVARRKALAALPDVCRTGTHLFSFVGYVEQFRGWGRALRRAVGDWYLAKSPQQVAYQATKYAQRGGWSHRDLLRLSKPTPPRGSDMDEVLALTVGKPVKVPLDGDTSFAGTKYFIATEEMKTVSSPREAVELIERYNMPWETLPSHLLRDPTIWAALVPRMGLTALIRNLGRMTDIGYIAPFSDGTAEIVKRLSDVADLRQSRIHPLQILTAEAVYRRGAGLKGSLTWKPAAKVLEALDAAFYESFGNVEPTGKRTLNCLDVSGSMGSGYVAGSPLTPREASVALAMLGLKVEENAETMAFTGGFVHLDLNRSKSLADAVEATSRLPFDQTDCSVPMLWAKKHSVPVDTFVVYTDSETWAGQVKPPQALRAYREAMGIDAKLVVVGMVSNGFTIADPKDPGMLDVVGFDTATPNLISDFSAGKV
jgi:60 kDa SS-A/Ro ribonucleoprotein